MSKTALTIGALLLAAVTLTGCLGFQRVSDPTRFYVLSAVREAKSASPGSGVNLAVGVGRVDLPTYLLDRRIAVRHGANEITYSEYHRWAERLDKGLQRVLAANLSALLPSDRVVLSPWSRDEVQAELFVAFERFDIDDQGQVTLDARWRAASPQNDETWRSDRILITRQSAVFAADPDRAVAGLSDALADLSRQLTAALQSLPTGSRSQR